MRRAFLSRLPVTAHGAPPPELRKEQRLFTLLRIGKLLHGSGEAICRLRNISAGGFMGDARPAPAVGTLVGLELCEGSSEQAKVVWSQGNRFGAEFLAPQSVPAILSGAAGSPHQRQRAPRVAPQAAFATVLQGDRAARASVVNISQTGAAVFAYDLLLSPVARRDLRLEIDGLEPLGGILCWSANGAAGLQFERPLSFEMLAHWLWATSLALPSAGALH